MARTFRFVPFLILTTLLCGCSSEKFIPEGKQMLTSVNLCSANRDFDASSFRSYVRQESNARWFNMFKVPLALYSLSGRDGSKSLNKFFRRIGEAPVIYDSTLMKSTREGLTLAMINKGYLRAATHVELKSDSKKRKVKLKFTMDPGHLYTVHSIDFDVDEPEIEKLIHENESRSLLKINMPCDASVLDAERERIVLLLHRHGYYNVLKNFITYDVDTMKGPDRIDLLLRVQEKKMAKDTAQIYTCYRIRNVVVDVNLENENSLTCDSFDYRGIRLRYHGKRQFRPNVIYSQIKFVPGDVFNEDYVQATYRNFSNLQALRYAVIRMEPADSARLDCHVTLQANKVNGLSGELEGTNTSGDMGVAASTSFTNRNLFRGSEVWTTKLKGAFEAITGLEGYNDQNYFEISAETHLSFPRIIVPFMKEEKRRRLNGNSEISLQYNSQQRPEFHRRVLTGAWSYWWLNDFNRIQQKLDVVSVNYVFMPWISNTFRHDYLDSISNRSAIIRYSYENLFIVNSAYSFTYKSAGAMANGSIYQKNAYQIRLNVESAGNMLYLLAQATKAKRNNEGDFTLFNVAFAQYAKFDFDYARSFLINSHNSFAIHGAFGVAFPYGNASIIPFEKRYFAGGPNSVRGWSIRELGPGSYIGKDGKVDFINQTGNLKLLFSAEWRSYLFWKFNGAFFVDAGNVWNTRNYDVQPGGQFRFDKFYKQIAMSYGLGLRLNLDYFILRLDWGVKAIDPAYESGRKHYPIIHPNLSDDVTFHFAVGLPF
ncbi:MAG: BamA/TamA family outer membrane protein [Bacteroidaceae bacterium]|nr:BamA/TamA family outer membrane protein [Bacteroidaceae bacterium]